jgi:hypothetical protein
MQAWKLPTPGHEQAVGGERRLGSPVSVDVGTDALQARTAECTLPLP